MSESGTEARDRTGRGREAEIRAAAARIFHDKGYDATSIQDIADAVGILKGSIYYYIDTKEDLLFDVIRGVHEIGIGSLKAWSETDADALTRLRTVIEGHVCNNLEHLVEIGVFFHDFRSLSPERRAEIVQDRDVYDRNLRLIIEAGQTEGTIDPDVDPKLAAMAILGMMNWTYQWYRPGGEQTPEEIAHEFANLALAGLAVRDGAPPRDEIGTEEAHG